MKELLGRIKSTGYWCVVIRPDKFVPNRIISVAKAEDIMQSCTVRFRGWPYPYFPESRRNVTRHTEYIQGFSDSADQPELWRLYLTGQFVHYFAMREDLIQREDLARMGWDVPRNPNVPVLSVGSTLFSFTEIYEFAARLAERGVLGDLLQIEVFLYKTRGRALVILDLNRAGFFDVRSADTDEIKFARTVARTELLAKADELALDESIKCFEYFHWDDPPRRVLREDQEKFKARRY